MKINKNLLSLIPLTAVAVTTITSVFAWYVSTIGITQDLSDGKLAANASYYESGDGSEENPFIISNARHLYNLAWLQDLGYYDDKVYYFELKNDIDMSQLKVGSNSASPIPAIGIDDHPFISSFNGNGYTINNLFVATSFSSSSYIKPSQEVLNDHNQTQTKKTYNTTSNTIISSYNGLFGIIKKYNDSSDSKSKVTNFTIANAKIESSQNTLVGYICGYVNSNLSNIGVASSNLTIGKDVTNISTTGSTYPISKYGIVGDYNNANGGIQWEQSGGDIGYGTSTDIRELYYDLGGSDNTSSIEVKGKQALPFRPDENNKKIEDASQTTAIVNLSESTTGDVNLASNQQAAKNNIGYYVGNSVKAFRDSSVTSLTITKPSTYYSFFSTDVPDEVTSFLNKEVTDKSGNTAYNYQYSIFISDSTQTALSDGYSNANNLNLVERAIVNDFTSCSSYKDSQGKLLLVPNRCIWVAPKQAGEFKMVVYNTENTYLCQLAIYRLIRSTPKDYSTYFTSATKFVITNGEETSGTSANITIPKSNSKTALQAYYYTFDVSDEDVKAGYEFAITQNTGKPYIAYLDIGANGTDTPTYIGTIEDIDYTYYTDSNKTGYAIVNTSDGFTLSGVYFNIDGTTTKEVALYVMRSLESSHLVYYYFVSDGGLTNKVTGTATDAKTKEDFDKLS